MTYVSPIVHRARAGRVRVQIHRIQAQITHYLLSRSQSRLCVMLIQENDPKMAAYTSLLELLVHLHHTDLVEQQNELLKVLQVHNSL